MTKQTFCAIVRDLASRPEDFLAKFKADAKRNGVDEPTMGMFIKSLNKLHNMGALSTPAVLILGIYAHGELRED